MDHDYVHPASERIYRQGDPAHRFAQLVAALARQSDEFLRHHNERLAGRDYLAQHAEWQSDPQRLASSMVRTIEAIEAAFVDVNYDRDAYQFGLGEQDAEWQRKYG